MPSRSLRPRYTPEPHRCCGALISIGAYGDWHLCEACESLLSPRHSRRRTCAIGAAAPGSLGDTGSAAGSRGKRPRKPKSRSPAKTSGA